MCAPLFDTFFGLELTVRRSWLHRHGPLASYLHLYRRPTFLSTARCALCSRTPLPTAAIGSGRYLPRREAASSPLTQVRLYSAGWRRQSASFSDAFACFVTVLTVGVRCLDLRRHARWPRQSRRTPSDRPLFHRSIRRSIHERRAYTIASSHPLDHRRRCCRPTAYSACYQTAQCSPHCECASACAACACSAFWRPSTVRMSSSAISSRCL